MVPDAFTKDQALMLLAYIAAGSPRTWTVDACRRALHECAVNNPDFVLDLPIDRIDPLVLQQWVDLAVEWGWDKQLKGRDF
jgi:hypothetical protein